MNSAKHRLINKEWKTGNLLMSMVWVLVLMPVLALVLVLASAPMGCIAAHSSVQKTKGATKMPDLEISILISNPEILIGESLWVEVTLENKGNADVEVPRPDSDREFEYTLRRIDPQPGQPFKISSKLAQSQKTADTVPDLPRLATKLDPKNKLRYKEDLTPSFISMPLAGTYEVVAAYNTGTETISSPAGTVAIVSPRVSDMATVTTADWENLASVFLHQTREGARVLFQRESDPENFQEGVQFRRTVLKDASIPPMVATAIELDEDPSGRWFAWLEDKGLGAGAAQEATLFFRIPPEPLDLKHPQLHPIGWQYGENAIFLALGLDSKNRVSLNAVSFEAAGKVTVATVALSAAKMPGVWAARLITIDPAPTLDVVWCETGPGRTWLFKQTITPMTGQVGAVQTLCEHSETLTAISLYPLKGSSPDVVDLIYGPSKEAAPFNYLRLPLSGGNPVLDVDIPLPQKDPAILPRAWALAAKPLKQPSAIALFENQLMLLRLDSQPQWHSLSKGTFQAGHLHLEVIGENGLWAIWADGRLGLQYQFIR